MQAYLRHLLRDRHRSWSTLHIVVHGLRFFYHTTLKRDRTTFEIPGPRQPIKLPVVLSPEEIERVLEQTTVENIVRCSSPRMLPAYGSTK